MGPLKEASMGSASSADMGSDGMVGSVVCGSESDILSAFGVLGQP